MGRGRLAVAVLPVVLVAVAAAADPAGAHSLAFDALLVAVPFASVAALLSFGEYLDRPPSSAAALQALLWAASVILLVLSCAVRRHAVDGVPPLAVSSVVMCLGLFAVKVTIAAAPLARRLADVRPAKP